MIVVLDYGVCNVGSIQNMLKKIGAKDVKISADAADIAQANHLILPGVGSFDMGMQCLEQMHLVDPIREYALIKKSPLLGICLGMQMLGRGSEEGTKEGLGLIPMECKKFHFENDSRLKVPHMGWNRAFFEKETPLTKGIESPQRYYFVHSYHTVCDEKQYELMYSEYGYRFTCGVHNGNIYGVQFHPEKSHQYGMKLLKNFVEQC